MYERREGQIKGRRERQKEREREEQFLQCKHRILKTEIIRYKQWTHNQLNVKIDILNLKRSAMI
jgi:hypothetical protein